MEFKPLKLSGCYEILLDPHHDDRGYFMRTYDLGDFVRHQLSIGWLQENQSMSLRQWTIRGLHFQKPPFAETKLVRAVIGIVLDVFVDLRKDSPSYGQWEAVELSANAFNMVYIPKGFAHGYCTLTDNTVVGYKVDAGYTPKAEGGLCWNDVDLNIAWPTSTPHISDRDQALPSFRKFESPFTLANTILDRVREKAHV